MTIGSLRLVVLAGLASAVLAPSLHAQTPTQPPLVLAQPEPQNGAPPVITLPDALERARTLDAQFQSASTDAQIAREDRVQARAGLLPSFSETTQYLGTQGDTPLATGRFVSNDGVNLYRQWAVARGGLTAGTFLRTPVKRAQAAEARGRGAARNRQPRFGGDGHGALLRARGSGTSLCDGAAGGLNGPTLSRHCPTATASGASRTKRRDQSRYRLPATTAGVQRDHATNGERAARARGSSFSDAERKLHGCRRSEHAPGAAALR